MTMISYFAMSNFGATAKSFLDRTGRTQVWLANATGIDESTISRLLKGTKTQLKKPSQLFSLVQAITDNQSEQASLLAAYLTDQIPNPMKDFLEIGVRSGSRVKPIKAVIDELDHALAVLQRCATADPEIRDIIIGMAGKFEHALSVATIRTKEENHK